MNYKKIVIFDLEMCCWENEKRIGEIIEIGLVSVDLESREITKEAQYYVKPEKDNISEYCTNLTKITPKIIKKEGRPLSEVIKTIQKNFGGKNTIYGAWGRDDQVLVEECKNKKIPLFLNEFVNIATWYRMKKLENGSRVSLELALKEQGLSFEGQAHSGIVDAKNTAKLFLHIF